MGPIFDATPCEAPVEFICRRRQRYISSDMRIRQQRRFEFCSDQKPCQWSPYMHGCTVSSGQPTTDAMNYFMAEQNTPPDPQPPPALE